MTFDLNQYLEEKTNIMESNLPLQLDATIPSQLLESMKYSLMAGGKRLRPILILATLESFGKDIQIGLPAAYAIEMVHTYSLIHDDLPAMDDDDFRRGILTNHKKFGEATAILAGDALLTEAFQVLSRLDSTQVEPLTIVQLIKELAVSAGGRGMVGGQMADLLGEGRELLLEELQYIHEHKTADLLVFCIRAGAILARATEEQLALLTEFGRAIGLAFQIQDDILDVYGDENKLGKPVGSDQEKAKSTYPGLLGLEKSQQILDELVRKAKQALYKADVQVTVLEAIADFIVKRDK